jgi:transcriptional regulator with XRE-family HTH domain
MAQSGDGPTVARLRLGQRLKELRAAAGITGGDAGAAIRSSASKISRLESGLLPVRERDVTALLGLYGAAEAEDRDELLALAKESTRPGWWDPHADMLPAHIKHALEMEAAASVIMAWDCLAVPALLQTPRYAHAVATGSQAYSQWRGGLTARQLAHRATLLTLSPSPPRLWAVIDEAALRRPPPGDPAILREQLTRLISHARKPNITVQVLPAGSTAAVRAAGPFSLLRLPGPTLADVVFTELLTSITCLERSRDVDRHWEIFNQLAVSGLNPSDSLQALQDIAESAGDLPAKRAATAGPSELIRSRVGGLPQEPLDPTHGMQGESQ